MDPWVSLSNQLVLSDWVLWCAGIYIQFVFSGSREEHHLPLIEILVPSWAWRLCSGSLRNWLKTSGKVELKVTADCDKIDGNLYVKQLCNDNPAFPHQAEFLLIHQRRHVFLASTRRSSHSPLSLNWRLWLTLSKLCQNTDSLFV